MTRLCIVQHHPLETPGHILTWAQARGMQVRVQHAWALDVLPNSGDFDAIILLGGPFSVADAGALPWLANEIAWLKCCVDAGVPIFAICLGAQLLAHCMGAKVTRMAATELHEAAELGWIKVNFCAELAALGRFRPVLQWHEDTFEIPSGAHALAHSAVGHINQGFKLANRALMGVQFHPEWSASVYASLIECLATPETSAPLRAALSQPGLFDTQETLCMALLDFWDAK